MLATHQESCNSHDGGACSACAWKGHGRPCHCTLTRSAERLLIWQLGKGMCCCTKASASRTADSALSLPLDAACSQRAAARAGRLSLLGALPDELAAWACLLWQTLSRSRLSIFLSSQTSHLSRHKLDRLAIRHYCFENCSTRLTFHVGAHPVPKPSSSKASLPSCASLPQAACCALSGRDGGCPWPRPWGQKAWSRC